jgi:hypothetical protein
MEQAGYPPFFGNSRWTETAARPCSFFWVSSLGAATVSAAVTARPTCHHAALAAL